MRIQVKIGLAASLMIGLTGLSISATALLVARSSEFSRIDQALRAVTDAARTAKTDAVSPALGAVDAAVVPLALAAVTADEDVTSLVDSKVKLPNKFSDGQLITALSRPVSLEINGLNLRMASVQLSEGNYLVVAASLAEIEQSTRRNLLTFTWITLIAVTIGSAITVLIIGRDMKDIRKLIFAAEKISNGEFDAKVEIGASSDEVANLSKSLSEMSQVLLQAIDTHKAAQQRMREFLGDASHELKTPLTVLRGYSELLQNPAELSSEQISNAQQRIREQLFRMENLIKDLLLLSEVGSPVEIESSELDFSSLLEAEVQDFVLLEPNRELDLHVSEQQTIHGSAWLLKQMVQNILSNIRAHTESIAAVRIQLTGTPSEVNLLIEDAGPGLPPSAYTSGIQNFRRYDQARSRDNGGSGLGMSIMQAIVSRHGGSIQLRPSELGGLAVQIRLPKETGTGGGGGI